MQFLYCSTTKVGKSFLESSLGTEKSHLLVPQCLTSTATEKEFAAVQNLLSDQYVLRMEITITSTNRKNFLMRQDDLSYKATL